MRLRRIFTVVLGGAFALTMAAVPAAFAQAINPGSGVNSVTGAGNGPGSPGTNAPNVKINGPYSPAHPHRGNDLVKRNHAARSHSRKTRPAVGNGRPDSYFTGTRPLTAHPARQPGGHGVTGSSNMSID